MNLKTYNAANSFYRFMRGATINLMVSGRISLSKDAAEMMDLSMSDKIVIHQDAADKQNWFIEKVYTNDGFILTERNNKKALNFHSKKIVTEIFKSFNIYPEKSKSFRISRNPVEFEGRRLYLIIKSK
jgi:hypothetical protein